MRDWFARTFPTLAAYPAGKWMMVPMTFFLAMGVLMGTIPPLFEVPKFCDPCHDIMLKRYDTYLCTGKDDALPDEQLAECRRKLGKPEVY